jgi:hypothetical protein
VDPRRGTAEVLQQIELDDVWKMRRLDLGEKDVFALTFRITEDNVRFGYFLF